MRPFASVLVFSLLFAVPEFATAQLPGGQVEATTPVMGQPTAKSLKSFRENLLKAGEQAQKAGEISRFDLIRLRFATLSPKALENLHQAAAEQVLSDGLCASYGAIDWTQLISFIKEIIPLILELIKLFSATAFIPQSQFLVGSGWHSLALAA